MNITITTKNVYDYALALTSRAGKQSEDYANVALTEDNYPMLDVYLSSAIAHAEGELKKRLTASNSLDLKVEEDSVSITVKGATRMAPSIYSLVETSIRLFMGYYIAAEWLRPTPAGILSEVYGTTAADHLKTAVSSLNQKEGAVIGEENYSDRTKEGNVRMEGSGISSNYSDRTKEGNVRMDRTGTAESCYSRRSKDNVQAQPGYRISDVEILTLNSPEDCCLHDFAVTGASEFLISKP